MFLVEPGFLQFGQNLGSCQLLFNLTVIIIIFLSLTRRRLFSEQKRGGKGRNFPENNKAHMLIKKLIIK
jgi:hypothetical protein